MNETKSIAIVMYFTSCHTWARMDHKADATICWAAWDYVYGDHALTDYKDYNKVEYADGYVSKRPYNK